MFIIQFRYTISQSTPFETTDEYVIAHGLGAGVIAAIVIVAIIVCGIVIVIILYYIPVKPVHDCINNYLPNCEGCCECCAKPEATPGTGAGYETTPK